MASFSVQYIFSLVDRFTPGANKMGAAATTVAKAVDSAGKAMSTFGSMTSRVQGVFSAVASGAQRAASAVLSYVRAMVSASNVKPPGGGSAFSAIAARHAKEAKEAQRQQNLLMQNKNFRESARHLSPMNIWANWQMGKAAMHGADSFIKQFAEPDTMRRKMAFTLGGDARAEDLASKALQTAKDFSEKYANTSVTENMKIIDDLRANLPESMEKILDHSVEPFVKLHSFFKAWEGGKHVGKAEESLRDISLAIRSGELMGNVTAGEIANHAHRLAMAKAVFGEKFKVSEYFTAQKRANQALPGMSDDFKYVGFPLLVQELGVSAGVGLATQFNKTIGGIRMTKPQVAAWRKLGLVDEDLVKRGIIKTDKKGDIVPSSIVGKKWQKGIVGDDPFLDMITRVLPALDKTKRVKGLDSASLLKAWKDGDPEGVAKQLKAIDKLDLSRELTALYGDRTAIMQSFSEVMRLASLARDYLNMRNVEKSFQNADPTKPIDSYETSVQRVAASFNRLTNATFGKDAVDVLIGGLDSITSAFNRLSEVIKKDGGLVGPLKMFADYMAGDKNKGILGDGLLGKVRDKLGFGDPKPIYSDTTPVTSGIFEQFQRLPQKTESILPKFFQLGPQPAEPMSWSGRSFAADAAASVPQSMAIRMEPLQVNIPPSVQFQVTVSGTVNGPVSGSGFGSIPLSTNAPRGTATPEAGAAPN